MSDALLARAQLMLGQVDGFEAALSRALDELDRERDRGRKWDWRAACLARVAVLQGRRTIPEAARRAGLSARTLRVRWRRLGMPPEMRTIGAAVREVVDRCPGIADAEIALQLVERGYVNATRVSVMRARHAAGISSSFARRIDAERDEVSAYLRDYPWMTPADIRGAMLADGWPWPLDARRICDHVDRYYAVGRG